MLLIINNIGESCKMKREHSIWQNYHSENGGWKEFPENSIFSFMKETADKYPNYTAIEFEGKKISYKQLIFQIEEAAAALVASGIKKGDYVSVITPNTPQALISVYAINRIGAIANILHPLLSVNEVQKFVEDVNSTAIITLDMVYPKLAKMKWKAGLKPKIILSRIADALPTYKKHIYLIANKVKPDINPAHDVVYWNEFIADAKKKGISVPADTGKAEDIAVILYSGGTTGIPKGVMITNSNLNCLAVQSHDVYERDDIPGAHSLALMPIFHGFGLGVCMHGMLCNALHVFILPKYDMNACTKLIFKRKISFLFGVPALYEAISRSEEIEKKDLSFIKFIVTAGDKTSPTLMNKFNRQLEKGGSKAKMREAYGQTECTSGCCINPFFNIKIGSIGIPYADTLMKIVEPGTHKEVPVGESGEICICGPAVMKGYYNNPEETAKVLQIHEDGKTWLHTGDIGYVDEDGYYYFGQRYCRMIITAGYNVYPSMVENAIYTYRAVKTCCVIGVKNPVIGQKIRAYIVLNNPDADKEEAKKKIIECCKKNVAEYSIPHEFVFRDKLPVSSLGKIDFNKLEDGT